MTEKLDTGIKDVRNVLQYRFGDGSLMDISKLTADLETDGDRRIVFFIDEYFRGKNDVLAKLNTSNDDEVVFVSTSKEPSTDYVDSVVSRLRSKGVNKPLAIAGMGGGITMDVAKAVSNLLTNEGMAKDYQGWDLVKVPGIYKIGIPTISGTGAEATRTCVMTNKETGLKLGMNSDYTVYDQLILDPSLTKTVPRNQYFYTGVDAYIHCIESLSGSYRNAIGDAYSNQTLDLCREVFLSDDMKSDENRANLMVASYLGGCAIATSYVGVVHPFSAGLSVVLGIHHCLANCITMRAMREFYPDEFEVFWEMCGKQEVDIPKGICRSLNDEEYDRLYDSTIIHEKPLINALGSNYKEQLDRKKVLEIFKCM